MVAIGLLKGDLTAKDYEDETAANPHIDQLRAKMEVTENVDYTRSNLAPSARSIANALQIQFLDGSKIDRVEVLFPIGHERRRSEGIPKLMSKFSSNLRRIYSDSRSSQICGLCENPQAMGGMAIDRFLSLFESPDGDGDDHATLSTASQTPTPTPVRS